MRTSTSARWLGASLVLALLAGCSGSTVGTPSADGGAATSAARSASSGTSASAAPSSSTPSLTPEPSAAAPEVPVASAALDAQPSPVEGPRPVSVELERLGVLAEVEPVGVAEDGQMEIPPLAERAGWYRFGSAPGEDSGTAVIAAHVDSIASGGLGPFAALGEASEGDEISVRLEDGSRVRFTVDRVERLTKSGIDWSQVFEREGPARLVLITCGGRWLRELGHYEDNVLVHASPRR